ncbi:glycosyltransferase family 2 protein [Butyrivibrio sp. AD3002]|uniref:glycosyltransferase family 2 protein n=1 Tax=Butyrivibrio sp. AD3002 TaxID=1280670 RepID=UPI0003B5DE81|nr:glycosyltransferase [Butyrivibrio sp. AD3002]
MRTGSNKLVSIIIPVYNVEKYLDECVESVIVQSYENIEIILVDDGSTDSCGMLCDKWATKDSRIKVVHRPNGGLSAARNSGLEIAKGDYISFVDSDDSVKKAFIEDFIDALENTGADFAFCDIESARLAERDRLGTEQMILSDKECRQLLIDPLSREYVEMVVAWNKIYKKDLIKDLRYKEGKIHEDEFMINNFIYSFSKAVYIPHRNYIYRVNDEGITGSENRNDLRHLDAVDAYEERMQKALDNNDIEFANSVLKWALLKLVQFYRHGNESMKAESYKKYRLLYDGYKKYLSEKQRIKYCLFKFKPEIFYKLF